MKTSVFYLIVCFSLAALSCNQQKDASAKTDDAGGNGSLNTSKPDDKNESPIDKLIIGKWRITKVSPGDEKNASAGEKAEMAATSNLFAKLAFEFYKDKTYEFPAVRRMSP